MFFKSELASQFTTYKDHRADFSEHVQVLKKSAIQFTTKTALYNADDFFLGIVYHSIYYIQWLLMIV